MRLEIYGEKNFFRTINFFKKRENWMDILETAANNLADDLKESARNKVSRHYPSVTGKLQDSIEADVDVYEDTVDIVLSSDHPAAGIMEYGGYSPFPPWDGRVADYAKSMGVEPYSVAKGIYQNQPFAEAHPFMRPAMKEGMPALEKEIYAAAKALKP